LFSTMLKPQKIKGSVLGVVSVPKTAPRTTGFFNTKQFSFTVPRISGAQQPSQRTVQRTGGFEIVSPRLMEVSSTRELDRTAERLLGAQKLKPAQKTKPSERVQQGERFFATTRTSQAQLQRTTQRMKQAQRVSFKFMAPPVTETPKPPPSPPAWLPKLSFGKKGGALGFDVLLRRKGKWQTVGTGLEKASAMGLGAWKARSTLGRSFKIVPSALPGKFVPGFAGLFKQEQFRQPKSAVLKGALVEKASFGLDLPTEVGEIRASKRSKSVFPKILGFSKKAKQKRKRR
jgi:hypothetical protein